MPSTATTRNRFEKQASGENANTWGTKVNVVWDMIDACLDGVLDITTAGGTTTLTNADYTADQAKNRVLNCTGDGGTVVIPNANKVYLVRNASSGDVIVQTDTPTASATVKAGNEQWVFCNGSASVFLCQVTNFGADNLSTTGTLASGNLTVTGTASVSSTLTVGTTNHATATNLQIGGATIAALSATGLSITGGITASGSISITNGLLDAVTSGTGVHRFKSDGFPLAVDSDNAAKIAIRSLAGSAYSYIGNDGSANSLTFYTSGVVAMATVSSTGLSVTGMVSATSIVKTGTYTVAGLPAAGTAGRTAFVTDANATTFASIVAGGGANGVPVYDDGTNWRIG